MRHILLPLLLIATCGFGYYQATHATREPLHTSINEPGQMVHVSAHFEPGRINVFHFYADWCGACRNWAPTIEGINQYVPDMRVHCIDISEWDSPVAQQYGITFVPNFHIYDGQGRLIARDKPADRWLRKEMQQRAQARGIAQTARR